MRYGAFAIVFVEKRRFSNDVISYDYWLCVATGKFNVDKNNRGIPNASAYENVAKTAISKDFYDSFRKESALNHRQYAKR